MEGHRIVDAIARRADLRQPFPPKFVERLKGQTVVALNRRGKYLLAELSSGEALLMHLGMSGSFTVEPHANAGANSIADPHDHVVFHMSSGATITFNDPRRFGVMDLVPRARLGRALEA